MRTRFFVVCAIALALLGVFTVNVSAQVVPKSISAGGSDAAIARTEKCLDGRHCRRPVFRALTCASSMTWHRRSTTAIISAFFRSYPTAPRATSTICSICTASTQQSPNPMCSSISSTVRKTPNLDRRVQYIIRLPISELHILARDDVQSLEDLRGKKVNFGPAGTGASLTGT